MENRYARPTLEDIAEEIHISRTTIYKVINNKGTVSEKTRNTVLAALEKYHYTPNNNARNLAMNRSYVIALINYVSSDAIYFSSIIEKGVMQAIESFGDHGLVINRYTSPVNQPDKQITDMENAYAAGTRHFILSAADPDLMRPAINDLKAKGCTIILLSKPVPGAFADAFIGINDYKSGRLAAQLFEKMLPSGGKLQLLVAKKSLSNYAATTAKFQGVLDQISQSFPAVSLLPILNELDGRESIDAALTQALNSRQIDGILDLTYRLDIVSDVLARENRRDILLVGMDLFPEIENALASQTIDAVIFQNLKAQTFLACRLLFEYMCYSQEIKKETWYSKLEIVMSENMEYFLD